MLGLAELGVICGWLVDGGPRGRSGVFWSGRKGFAIHHEICTHKHTPYELENSIFTDLIHPPYSTTLKVWNFTTPKRPCGRPSDFWLVTVASDGFTCATNVSRFANDDCIFCGLTICLERVLILRKGADNFLSHSQVEDEITKIM